MVSTNPRGTGETDGRTNGRGHTARKGQCLMRGAPCSARIVPRLRQRLCCDVVRRRRAKGENSALQSAHVLPSKVHTPVYLCCVCSRIVTATRSGPTISVRSRTSWGLGRGQKVAHDLDQAMRRVWGTRARSYATGRSSRRAQSLILPHSPPPLELGLGVDILSRTRSRGRRHVGIVDNGTAS